MKKITLLLILSVMTLCSQAQDVLIYKVVNASFSVYNHQKEDWEEKEVNATPKDMFMVIKATEVKVTTTSDLRIIFSGPVKKETFPEYRSSVVTGIDQDGEYCTFNFIKYNNGTIAAFVFYSTKKPFVNVCYILKPTT